MTCVSTPISWLKLESYALDKRDTSVAKHLAECPACSASFQAITDDVVELPRLVVPERTPKRHWLWWLAPAMAAAAILMLVMIRREPTLAPHITTVKGGGQVVLGVVRERSGSIRRDVTTYAAGDRWKLTLTCEDANLWVDVAVVDPKSVDHPFEPVKLSCGNEVVVPGAFEITGRDANIVCAILDPDAAPPRTTPMPGTPGTACITLTPE